MSALRIEPIEEAVPREWRRVARDYPLLTLAAAFAAGVYLGRNHGRQLFTALVGVAVTAAVDRAKRASGLR
jgi:hypothetical protein